MRRSDPLWDDGPDWLGPDPWEEKEQQERAERMREANRAAFEQLAELIDRMRKAERRQIAVERTVSSVERELEELIELNEVASVREICTKTLQRCEGRR